MMVFAPDDKYCLSYRINQNELIVTQRKSEHKMNVHFDYQNYENSLCLELETIGVIMINQGD